MSLIRYQTPELSNWSPFDRLNTLRDEMGRLFDFSFPSRDTGLFSGWSPAVDLFDDRENFVVQVALPGLKKEDIQLNVHDGVLTVSGERKQEEGSKAFRSERYFGKFQRSVSLPAVVDSSK